MNKFKLKSKFSPAGDQINAINELVNGLKNNYKHQTLLGVTGSGKTFTIANVIDAIQIPTLVIAHNKTLAAQLAYEYKEFFPNNAVHYFVSYYDYYQPEAYLPITDTYIEKDAQINIEIDRLRHASTSSLLTRNDVIIVASVSCIYGLGSPKQYEKENLKIQIGYNISRNDFLRKLIDMRFERTNVDLIPGKFRSIGNIVDIMPPNEKTIYKIELFGNKIKNIFKIDAISSKILEEVSCFFLFPAKHFLTPNEQKNNAFKAIKKELKEQLKEFRKNNKNLEAERLERRVNYDLSLIKEVGYCNGIENYSRYLSGKKQGEPPYTLLDYFPNNFLTIIDESHVTIPQLQGMYAGDHSRKQNLIEYGFRLPSALDNRPLKFDEFNQKIEQVIYTSATPSLYEKNKSVRIIEQIIRPTGLIDPEIIIKPITSIKQSKIKTVGQVDDVIKEIKKTIKNGSRAIVTTLTKKMAEDLSFYLKEQNIKTKYLHSDIKTLERIKIITEFRKGGENGGFDCIVGVNLLREGLDLPEVAFIGVLDADKEGFLRSETSLIQIIGRAARNSLGKVILYADNITGSIKKAVEETNRRRDIQIKYNKKHKITPKTIIKKISDIVERLETNHQKSLKNNLEFDKKIFDKNPKKFIRLKEKEMNEAVKILDFETAAIIRDEIKILKR